MYVCQKCGSLVGPGIRAHTVVTQRKRSAPYHDDSPQHISREEKWCPHCAVLAGHINATGQRIEQYKTSDGRRGWRLVDVR